MSNINSPDHYNQGGIETIEVIKSMGDGPAFCRGNIIKYVSRYEHKNGVEDLKKALWYMELLIELETPVETQRT